MDLAWGIIGAGDIARRHMAPAIQRAPRHRLAAVMRRDDRAAEQFATDFEVPRWYTSVDALLADRDVNAVYIATPPSSHAELTFRAAEAGKHVLCEKPLALSAAEARQMIDTCASSGVRLMVCHYQRFNTRHRKIRDWVKQGRLGRIVSARINFSSFSPAQPGQWRREANQSGGGPLMDLGSHCLDLLMFVCGPIDWSSAVVDAPDANGVEDAATLLLRFGSGAHGIVSTYWSARIPDEARCNGLELWGIEGSAAAAPLFSKDSSGTLTLYTQQGAEDHSVSGGMPIHESVIEDFRIAIETGGPVGCPAEDAFAGLEIIEAAYSRHG